MGWFLDHFSTELGLLTFPQGFPESCQWALENSSVAPKDAFFLLFTWVQVFQCVKKPLKLTTHHHRTRFGHGLCSSSSLCLSLGAGNKTQVLASAKQVLCHWATALHPPAPPPCFDAFRQATNPAPSPWLTQCSSERQIQRSEHCFLNLLCPAAQQMS